MNHAQQAQQPIIRSFVRSISLSHFRNYRTARVEAGESANVLIGPNGAGKTNLLEAISLLTPGRGLRRAVLSDMDNIGDAAPWVVSAEITGPQGEADVGTGHDTEGDMDKRIVKIDGKISRGQNELGKYFSALWLTPQMDNLFIEGGTARRKFLDRLVYSFDGDHVSRINAYDFAMRERNRLLQAGRADPLWLSALEQKMAEQGLGIAVARAHAAERLNSAMLLSEHSFPQAHMSLSGLVENALAEGSALAAEERFKEALEQNRPQDAAAGRTLVGVHRAQVEVLHVEKNMAAERCSTGEQKALLVSIILAQSRAGSLWHGHVPVLLLDEVATHLDSTRRTELFAELTSIGAQCWLTGTDHETFEGLKGQFLRVESGRII